MKVTLITGASGGIGAAFARTLAKRRQNLVLVARSEDKLHELCDELMFSYGITAHYVAVDLNDFEADQRLFLETEEHGMEVDCLINNAGFGSMGDFVELELERELEMIGLNVMVLVALTHRYLRGMRKRKGGTIINVSSTAGFQPVPYMATYAATKAFVTSFTEAIAEENRQYGITATALCPGPTETNFFATANATPFSAMQTADEVVETALKAVERKKSHVISGWTNYLKAHAATITPNSLVTKFISAVIRPKLKAQKKLKD
jgi:short-subunit dehydrogenase